MEDKRQLDNGWNKSDLNTVRLQNAVLCADCEIISDSPHDTCEVCGSRSLASLALILGGLLPVQRTRLVETAVPQPVVVTPSPALAPARTCAGERMPTPVYG